MGTNENKAADQGPPKRSGVFCFATSATSTDFVIPADWKGNFITVGCKGEEIQIQFGDANVSVTFDQVATESSGVMTVNAATGYPIPADQERHFRVPLDKDITHFAVDAAGTTGFWFAYLSNNFRL